MSDSHLTVSIRTANALIDAATAEGAARDELLWAAALTDELLEDPDHRIAYKSFADLYRKAEALTGEAFGIRAAQRTPDRAFGIVAYMAANSPDLGAAYHNIARYFRLLVDGVEVRLIEAGKQARFLHRFPAAFTDPPRSQEYVLGAVIAYGRQWTRVDFRPLAVRFPLEPPADYGPYEALFRCPVDFQAPCAEIVFERELLALPTVQSDPALLQILDRHGRDLLAQLPDEASYANRLRALLSQRLRGVAPTLERTAQELGISPRTLQRRLREEGTSHQYVLDEIRRELALRYLSEARMAISEVAFLLGFSEASAFHRAFRRWTGHTPADYRSRAA